MFRPQQGLGKRYPNPMAPQAEKERPTLPPDSESAQEESSSDDEEQDADPPPPTPSPLHPQEGEGEKSEEPRPRRPRLTPAPPPFPPPWRLQRMAPQTPPPLLGPEAKRKASTGVVEAKAMPRVKVLPSPLAAPPLMMPPPRAQEEPSGDEEARLLGVIQQSFVELALLRARRATGGEPAPVTVHLGPREDEEAPTESSGNTCDVPTLSLSSSAGQLSDDSDDDLWCKNAVEAFQRIVQSEPATNPSSAAEQDESEESTPHAS